MGHLQVCRPPWPWLRLLFYGGVGSRTGHDFMRARDCTGTRGVVWGAWVGCIGLFLSCDTEHESNRHRGMAFCLSLAGFASEDESLGDTLEGCGLPWPSSKYSCMYTTPRETRRHSGKCRMQHSLTRPTASPSKSVSGFAVILKQAK